MGVFLIVAPFSPPQRSWRGEFKGVREKEGDNLEAPIKKGKIKLIYLPFYLYN